MPYARLTPMSATPQPEDPKAVFDAKAYVTIAEMKTAIDEMNLLDFASDQSYTAPATVISMDAGTIALFTLTAPTVLTEDLTDGQRVLVHITGAATHGVTWPATTWVSDLGNVEPVLSDADIIAFWKVGTTLYSKYIGFY